MVDTVLPERKKSVWDPILHVKMSNFYILEDNLKIRLIFLRKPI